VALPDLEPDALHILVFGPGVGELIIVRAPPGVWMVIDGCSAAGVSYGQRVVKHYGAAPGVVVFTHPHLDHARGVAQVVDAATQGPPEGWPTLGMLPLYAQLLGGRDEGANPAADYDRGVTENAIATILDRWERHPPCRWGVSFGDQRALGDAIVKVLSPHSFALNHATRKVGEGRVPNWNTVSTALSLEWRGRRVLLGADLVEKPLQGWRRAQLAWSEIAEHAAMKVPHHGSAPALSPFVHPRAVAGIITPYSPSPLPSFADDGGVAWLLAAGADVILTSLPRAHEAQASVPITMRRTVLDGGGAIRFDPVTPGYPDCFVAASFIEGQDAPTLRFGPGSVRVLP